MKDHQTEFSEVQDDIDDSMVTSMMTHVTDSANKNCKNSQSEEDDVLSEHSNDNKGNKSGRDGKQKRYNQKEVVLWHLRLGHAMPLKAVRGQIKKGLLPKSQMSNQGCDNCIKGKFARSYKGTLTKSQKFGHLHADVKGSIEEKSVDGFDYFLSLIDEKSRYIHAEPIKTKVEASDALLRFVRVFEKQSGKSVLSVHSDGGKEFLRTKKALRLDGVIYTTITPFTPASNGLAERTHGVILSLARSGLKDSKLPMKYWSFAVRHSANFKHAVEHSSTKRVPFELLFNRSPPYLSHFRPFGCRMMF